MVNRTRKKRQNIKLKKNRTTKVDDKEHSGFKTGSIVSSVRNRKKIYDNIKNLKHYHKFSVQDNLGIFLPPSDQKSSGRCWIFAFLNILRIRTIYHYNLHPSFSFSPLYIFFWDQYEKSKYFLTQISKKSHLSLEHFDNYVLFHKMISDGGTWNMIQNIVNKYGVVPYHSMKETHHSIQTREFKELLYTKLKSCSKEIRESNKSTHEMLIQKHMKSIYNIMVKCFGKPPSKIKVSLNNVYHQVSPLLYYKHMIQVIQGNDVNNKIYFLNAPHLKYNTFYGIKSLNNMENNNDCLYFNVSFDDFKTLILNSLHKNIPVWFGSDYGKHLIKGEAMMNTHIDNYSKLEPSLKDKNLFLKKENAIPYFQTNINHAMIIDGYFMDKKQNIKFWSIENSHNSKLKTLSYENNHGKVTMSEDWFKENAVIAAIDMCCITNKKILSKIKDKKSIQYLPVWSNLGELL
jgi:bleomycin hydrolase